LASLQRPLMGHPERCSINYGWHSCRSVPAGFSRMAPYCFTCRRFTFPIRNNIRSCKKEITHERCIKQISEITRTPRCRKNVFHGTISSNTISGTWADVPMGATRSPGDLTLQLLNDERLYKTAIPCIPDLLPSLHSRIKSFIVSRLAFLIRIESVKWLLPESVWEM
jgi:hypothetical protein